MLEGGGRQNGVVEFLLATKRRLQQNFQLFFLLFDTSDVRATNWGGEEQGTNRTKMRNFAGEQQQAVVAQEKKEKCCFL